MKQQCGRQPKQRSPRNSFCPSCSAAPALLMLLPRPEQTERAQALDENALAQQRGANFGARKTETIRTPRAFCFNHPKRKLRQSFFHISGSGEQKNRDARTPSASAANCFVISGCPRATALQSM